VAHRGILYNKTMVTEPSPAWGILFDTKYKNNVFMIDSIRDCLGVTSSTWAIP
jgi:spermidine/putrescine transport system substrate-binding protein